MARPAGFAKQYSWTLGWALGWALALPLTGALTGALACGRAGIVTGTTACSPSCAVSCNWAWQAAALSDTATCVGATRLTSSLPHSAWAGPARSGLDVHTSHRPESAADVTIRSGCGTLTVSVLVSGCGPVTWTSRLVRLPAGTGTCTCTCAAPPGADQRPPPFSDTASRLWARTCRPAVPSVPSGGATRIVTVFEAGEKSHATRSGAGADPDRARQPAISATSDSAATRTTARRNRYCRAETGE